MPAAPARFERIAHRGMPAERRENTLEGFLFALDHGADGIELDVHLTRDGAAVVHHDARTGSHEIAATNWVQLSAIDLGGGARIPLLRDVLEAVADRAAVYIELKGLHVEEEVIRLAREHGKRFALHSFDHQAIERVARSAPEVARGILLDRDSPSPIETLRRSAERSKPRDVWPHWSLVSEQFMAAARDARVRVIVWTVNSVELAASLRDLGVHGICTDDVRILDNL